MTTPTDEQAAEIALSEFRTLARLSCGCVIAILVLRCFVIEPNHIPSGSMAPHRLGVHRDWVCSICKFLFHVGVRPDGTCPNCASFNQSAGSDRSAIVEGDRIWVDKTAFQFKTPQRYDEVVFFSPDDPLKPFIKRIAGLPGETVQIKNGDLWINNQIAKKTPDERKELSVLVFDQSFNPNRDDLNSRWQFHSRVSQDSDLIANWQVSKNGDIELDPDTDKSNQQSIFFDANYIHFCPNRQATGPVRDFLDYNGRTIAGDHVTNDLWYEVDVNLKNSTAIRLRLTNETLNIVCELQSNTTMESSILRINDELVTPQWTPIKSQLFRQNEWNKFEFSCVDQQLQLLLNGKNIIEPFNLEPFTHRRPDELLRNSPAGISFNGSASLRHFRLYRDIYLTERTADNPVMGHGVANPVQIPSDGYFVLGDNSGFSIDSRFWKNSPVLPSTAIIGKTLENRFTQKPK
jgi:signal peptidase I